MMVPICERCDKRLDKELSFWVGHLTFCQTKQGLPVMAPPQTLKHLCEDCHAVIQHEMHFFRVSVE